MDTVKYLFKSLFSNNTIIEGRKRPWYWSIIMAILSLVIIISPVLSSGYTDAGTNYIEPTNENGISTGLVQLSQEKSFQELYITHESKEDKVGKLVFNEDFKTNTNLSGHEVNSQTVSMYETNFTYSTKSQSSTNEVLLIVYSLEGRDFNNRTERENFISTYLPDSSHSTGYKSFICFSNTSFLLGLTTLNSSTTSTTTKSFSYFVGTYHHLGLDGDYKFGDNLTVSAVSASSDSEFLTKWRPFITAAYLYNRNKNIWINVGIYAGSFAGAMLLSALLIFLFSLSKKNLIHKDCTFWEAMKMAFTLSLTCSVIGALLCLMNLLYGIVFGVMAVLMRTSWLIMKTNGSGVAGDGQKPLYKAR